MTERNTPLHALVRHGHPLGGDDQGAVELPSGQTGTHAAWVTPVFASMVLMVDPTSWGRRCALTGCLACTASSRGGSSPIGQLCATTFPESSDWPRVPPLLRFVDRTRGTARSPIGM